MEHIPYTIPYHPCMVYLPIHLPYFTIRNNPNVCKYTSPMDPMGWSIWDFFALRSQDRHLSLTSLIGATPRAESMAPSRAPSPVRQ